MECFANDKDRGSGEEDEEEEEDEGEDNEPSRDDPSPPPAPPPPPPETYRQGNFKVGTLSMQALRGDIDGGAMVNEFILFCILSIFTYNMISFYF
jgi:hypothetical protein